MEWCKRQLDAYGSMKVLKVVPMGYHSSGSVRVFLLLGEFLGVVLWLVGLVWLQRYIHMRNAVCKAWRNHSFSRCSYDLQNIFNTKTICKTKEGICACDKGLDQIIQSLTQALLQNQYEFCLKMSVISLVVCCFTLKMPHKQ